MNLLGLIRRCPALKISLFVSGLVLLGVGLLVLLEPEKTQRALLPLLLALGVFLSLYLLLHWMVLWPARRLTELAVRLGRGEWSARSGLAPADQPCDGIMRLAQTLDRMAAQVERDVAARQQTEEARKQAEAALAQERGLLRTLIDTLPDSFFVKDQKGRYTLINVANARLMGSRTEPEVLGKTVFDFFPREIALLYHADDETVLHSGQPIFDCEEPYRTPDGRQGWFLTTKVPLLDAQGNVTGLVGIARDITERKSIEKALRQSEASLVLAQQIGHIGSWEADLTQDTLQWSRETFRIFGCDPDVFVPHQRRLLPARPPG